jgi:hypothetical protein
MTPPDDTAPPKKWKRHFERGTPKGALTWKSAKQRSARMFAWQVAVMAKFSTSHRVLRVAWLLHALCLKEGYAYPTDSYISKTLGIQLNHVQTALASLERESAIVRASCFVSGKPQRRIWPSAGIIPPTVGGIHTPHRGSRDTPHRRGTDSIRTAPTPRARLSTTAEAARRDSERREQANLRRTEAATGNAVPGEQRHQGAFHPGIDPEENRE